MAQLAAGRLADAETAVSAMSAADNDRLQNLCAGMVLNSMAASLCMAGRLAYCEALADRAIQMLKRSYLLTDAVMLHPVHILAAARLAQGKVGKAKQALADMLAIRCESPQDQAMVHGMAAALLQTEGNLRQAEAEYLSAARAWELANLGESAYAGAIYASLASLYLAERRNEDARRVLARALAIFDRPEGTVPMDRIRTLYVSGALHARLGEWMEAERDLSRAVELAEGEQRMDAFSLRVLLAGYAQALRKNGHRREARSIDARAATIPSASSSAAIVDMADIGNGARRRSK
ncbi:MAG: hypothetical protein HY820_46045 [Acidobacteria bacterium]|nr:hypothetical protein [Acidobacteriota bacterium]